MTFLLQYLKMNHWHNAPFHFCIKSFKALRFSTVLVLTGRAFQMFGP